MRHFLRLFWSSQNRKSVIFELAPGPRSALGASVSRPNPTLVVDWQDNQHEIMLKTQGK